MKTPAFDRLSRLTLGTVQLGMPYGRARPSRPPTEQAVGAILSAAAAGGITCFDTARAYGDAEVRLGSWLSGQAEGPFVISKLPPIRDIADDEVNAFVRVQLDASLRALSVDRLDGYLVHRGDDLLIPGVEAALCEARDAGRVGAFGASVYDPDQLAAILVRCQPDIVQLPLSLVDCRFVTAGLIERCAERGITVFARSAFLQGALLLNTTELPPHLMALQPCLDRLRAISADAGCGPVALFLHAVLQTPGVASLVVGVTGLPELTENLVAWRSPPTLDVVEAALTACGDVPEDILDPRTWPA